jgi:hypothetical protein
MSLTPHPEKRTYEVNGYRFELNVKHSHNGTTIESKDLGLEETTIQVGEIRGIIADCLDAQLDDVKDVTEDRQSDAEREGKPKLQVLR